MITAEEIVRNYYGLNTPKDKNEQSEFPEDIGLETDTVIVSAFFGNEIHITFDEPIEPEVAKKRFEWLLTEDAVKEINKGTLILHILWSEPYQDIRSDIEQTLKDLGIEKPIGEIELE